MLISYLRLDGDKNQCWNAVSNKPEFEITIIIEFLVANDRFKRFIFNFEPWTKLQISFLCAIYIPVLISTSYFHMRILRISSDAHTKVQLWISISRKF